jgi:hypothetical protein
MHTVRELNRWVNWADLTNLTADTTYYFIAGNKSFLLPLPLIPLLSPLSLSLLKIYTVYRKDGKTIASSKEYKVRTLPSNGTFNFITGGDMSVDINAEKVYYLSPSSSLFPSPPFSPSPSPSRLPNIFKNLMLIIL